ncbi:MAG: ActD-like protein [Myxococcales bacterium]|nr:ActD-like protein [Myxococcales bacterium]
MSSSSPEKAGASNPDRVPDLLLEQVHLGELPERQADEVRTRLDVEPGGPARLAALATGDKALFDRVPPAQFIAEVQRRQHLAAVQQQQQQQQQQSTPKWGWLAGPMVLATAVLLFVARPDGPSPSHVEPALGPATTMTERAKGHVSTATTGAVDLWLFRKRGDAVERMAQGAEARSGQRVQLGYHAHRTGYVAIVSMDGRGAVTRHLPVEGAAALKVSAGPGVMLDHSYELDDAPAYERFILVSSTAPFSVTDIERAAKALSGRKDGRSATLSLPSGAMQTSFLLTKVASGRHDR